jgi:hypothetical protein
MYGGTERQSTQGTGPNGISVAFFKTHLYNIQDDLLGVVSDTFLNLKVTTTLKQGTIVCLPKHSNPTTPDGFISSPSHWRQTG